VNSLHAVCQRSGQLTRARFHDASVRAAPLRNIPARLVNSVLSRPGHPTGIQVSRYGLAIAVGDGARGLMAPALPGRAQAATTLLNPKSGCAPVRRSFLPTLQAFHTPGAIPHADQCTTTLCHVAGRPVSPTTALLRSGSGRAGGIVAGSFPSPSRTSPIRDPAVETRLTAGISRILRGHPVRPEACSRPGIGVPE